MITKDVREALLQLDAELEAEGLHHLTASEMEAEVFNYGEAEGHIVTCDLCRDIRDRERERNSLYEHGLKYPEIRKFDGWPDCFTTIEIVTEELLDIEKKLGERFGVTENIREYLIALDKDNKLVEDELVADWHCAYASYVHWSKDDEYDDQLPETCDSQD